MHTLSKLLLKKNNKINEWESVKNSQSGCCLSFFQMKVRFGKWDFMEGGITDIGRKTL